MLTHLPRPDSPALDPVTGIPFFATDRRGLPRSTDGAHDIGAVERQHDDPDPTLRLYLPLIRR